MAFHFERESVLSATAVPILYAVAMGASGLGSLVFGRLFDRIGVGVLIPLTVTTALFAPLAFLGGPVAAGLGVLLWGIGIGVHDSIMQAAVAGMVPARPLASAYGLFNLGYGVAWFAGSVAMGILYDVSVPALVAVSIGLELAAIPLFLLVRRLRSGPPGPAV